ncbi:hypothetical protein BJ508DRAFT_335024 [Ascobolus immersus RN42]|uniref:Cyanovirin-N domain-containing protein n=1 Tax=Ascobolus immersus RN42 TaxID=1160509 RepID=A0A3N4HDU8_ASCIM|nr:hypothetical protein BJ508DRAFT_335024 [Ascobolus immersus RN42]
MPSLRGSGSRAVSSTSPQPTSDLRYPTALEYLCLDWANELALEKAGQLPKEITDFRNKEWGRKETAMRDALTAYLQNLNSSSGPYELRPNELKNSPLYCSEKPNYDTFLSLLLHHDGTFPTVEAAAKNFLLPPGCNCTAAGATSTPCEPTLSTAQLELILALNAPLVDVEITTQFWHQVWIETSLEGHIQINPDAPALPVHAPVLELIDPIINTTRKYRASAVSRFQDANGAETALPHLWARLLPALERTFAEPRAIGPLYWPVLIYLSHPGQFAKLRPSVRFVEEFGVARGKLKVGSRGVARCGGVLWGMVAKEVGAMLAYYEVRLRYVALCRGRMRRPLGNGGLGASVPTFPDGYGGCGGVEGRGYYPYGTSVSDGKDVMRGWEPRRYKLADTNAQHVQSTAMKINVSTAFVVTSVLALADSAMASMKDSCRMNWGRMNSPSRQASWAYFDCATTTPGDRRQTWMDLNWCIGNNRGQLAHWDFGSKNFATTCWDISFTDDFTLKAKCGNGNGGFETTSFYYGTVFTNGNGWVNCHPYVSSTEY